MIKYEQGNMFDNLQSVPTKTVNCKGEIGKGIALEAAQRYPLIEERYKQLCRHGLILPGRPRLIEQERQVLLFPTKNDWRYKSRYEWIDEGLRRIANKSEYLNRLSLPPLGCGNGGLDWNIVRQMIHDYLEDTSINVTIYGEPA